ncbi:CocE/NonD family hydrolase [Sphingosinicella sp. CPCC 101087]|uniref:CocE/NonD family hydrolase n=1 Tax=Sphingosinicella sp. CPCC 101087 TaxID=2497754 RepID=UPI00101C65D8|nr:CocE/NonD family hydrolase [Sphingosinicella sp. CPCC 101087]
MRDLLIAFSAALLASPVAPPAAAPTLAGTLADLHADAREPADLETLLRLQVAAGRWQDAEETIGLAAAAYRRVRSRREWALVPWHIYARTGRYEAEGATRADALARAFAELFASLPDRELAAVLPWYRADLDRLRDAQTQASEGCAGTAVDDCPRAAQLIAARQALAAWVYLMPASRPLIRAELERRFEVEDRLLIPVPGGDQVAAILIRPRNAAAKLTALMSFTIYANDEASLAEAVEMAAQGYAGMVAYTRGKGRGAGRAIPYEHDGADAAAVIDWLAAQDWSDGRVGMFSGSYNASTQWAAVKLRPRALKAIATHASNAPGIDTPMQGNVFQSFIYPWPLYTTATSGLDEINYRDHGRWAALNRIWYATGRPYRELERIDGHPNPVFARWLDHPSYDAYWQRLIPVGEEFARVDIPVFVQTGYHDGGMVGALHYLREHYRHRPDADHRLLIGPYHHTAMGQGVLPIVDGYRIDEAAQIDLRAVRMQWFDHVFRGAPLPRILNGRINFQVMGANLWRHVDSLEAMADSRMRFYLSRRREGEHLLFADTRPPTDETGPELRVDLADRRDADFQVPDGTPDMRNALVFTTPPVGERMEVAGLFRGRFEVVVNKRDLDLAVDFFERRADGRYFPLASYLGRASYMADRTRRQLLRPGRPHVLAFESQTITARQIEAGSRIVAVVGVPKRPDIQINYGTGRDVSDESIADAGEPLKVIWRPGSYLELGVRR